MKRFYDAGFDDEDIHCMISLFKADIAANRQHDWKPIDRRDYEYFVKMGLLP